MGFLSFFQGRKSSEAEETVQPEEPVQEETAKFPDFDRGTPVKLTDKDGKVLFLGRSTLSAGFLVSMSFFTALWRALRMMAW